MDGGAYAPIVSRILKSGRWVGSDGEEVSAEAIGVESQYLWRKISVRSVGVGERRRFPPRCRKQPGSAPNYLRENVLV